MNVAGVLGVSPVTVGDDYAAVCAQLGLDALPEGWLLVYTVDDSGERSTIAVGPDEPSSRARSIRSLTDVGRELVADNIPSTAGTLPGWPTVEVNP